MNPGLTAPVRSPGIERLAALDGLPADFSWNSLSPDGRLLAGFVDPTPNVSGDGSILDFQVYDVTTAEQVVDLKLSSYRDDFSQVVGWRDPTTPVLSAVRWGKTAPGELLAVSASDGGSEVLLHAGTPYVSAYYWTSRVAADVLAGGQVRQAQPPNQPWYDPRTGGPWLVDHWVWLLLAGLAVGGVWAAIVTERRGRRRTP